MKSNNAVFYFLLSFLSGMGTKSDYSDLPDDVIDKLSQVTSMSDVKRVFNITDDVRANPTDGVEMDENKGMNIGCKPREVIVNVPGNQEHFTFPHCVSISRCGGCCTIGHQCESAGEEHVNISVLRYDGILMRQVNVRMVRHVECKCLCRIKEADAKCNENQIYHKDSCLCRCKPELKVTCPAAKRLSKHTCICECKDKFCPSGQTLDKDTCKCKAPPGTNVIFIKDGRQTVITDAATNNQNEIADPKNWAHAVGNVDENVNENMVEDTNSDSHGIDDFDSFLDDAIEELE